MERTHGAEDDYIGDVIWRERREVLIDSPCPIGIAMESHHSEFGLHEPWIDGADTHR